MSDEPIADMRARAAQCRRLAASIMDRRAIEALLKMAADIEADIARLEAERASRENEPEPPNPQ